jgi:FKBP-type peptidyl-prolyl cis-trans isomerase
MKFGWSLALVALFAAGSAFAQSATSDKGKASSAADTAADKDKISYALGFQIGSNLAGQKLDVDIATVTRAMQDAYAKKPPAVPEDQMRDALTKLEAKAKADADRMLGDNKREADAFMKDNKTKKGVVELSNGVQYKAIEDGTGKPVLPTSEVTFHVRVSLTNGREIRSSFVGDPLTAKISEMPGIFGTKLLSEVIQKMKVGDHWMIYLPPEQASGNQVFIWEVKIIDVK